MTEDQAKTKWCPFARVFLAGDYWQSTNGADLMAMTADNMRPLTRCIASACIAWRWGVEHPGGGWIECAPNKAIAESRAKEPSYVVGGYCGLAGKPT